jgi:hypothetical protein
MKRTKHYVNGLPESRGEGLAAKEFLVRTGLIRKLGNWGPFFPNKLHRQFSVVETFVREGFEWTIIESEVISLGLNLETSAPHKSLEAWYQPVGC